MARITERRTTEKSVLSSWRTFRERAIRDWEKVTRKWSENVLITYVFSPKYRQSTVDKNDPSD